MNKHLLFVSHQFIHTMANARITDAYQLIIILRLFLSDFIPFTLVERLSIRKECDVWHGNQ